MMQEEEEEEEEHVHGASFTDDLETLHRRRTEELNLISKFDSASINPRRQCWYLVETPWLEAWAKFVRGEGPPPGKINNSRLLESDLKTPKEGLRPKIDYRGVNPMVWHLYKEMYGTDAAPELCRYIVNIDEMPVPRKYMPEIAQAPKAKAKVEAQKLRWRVEPPLIKPEDPALLLGCVSEATVEWILLQLFTCCGCCKGGRGQVYGPARYRRVVAEEDEDDEDEVVQSRPSRPPASVELTRV